MVSIVPPIDNGALGNARQAGRSEAQHPSDRRRPAETEKRQPASAAGGVSLRLSEAAREPLRQLAGVRGTARAAKAGEALSGAAADLDRKADGFGPASDALEAKRTALALALATGDSANVATAARELAEAKADSKEEPDGFPYRASLVVEERTVAYDPESRRYVPSIRRMALSVEKEPGEALVDSSRVEVGAEGVAVIHRDPAVPMRERFAGASPALVRAGGDVE